MNEPLRLARINATRDMADCALETVREVVVTGLKNPVISLPLGVALVDYLHQRRLIGDPEQIALNSVLISSAALDTFKGVAPLIASLLK